MRSKLLKEHNHTLRKASISVTKNVSCTKVCISDLEWRKNNLLKCVHYDLMQIIQILTPISSVIAWMRLILIKRECLVFHQDKSKHYTSYIVQQKLKELQRFFQFRLLSSWSWHTHTGVADPDLKTFGLEHISSNPCWCSYHILGYNWL